MKKRQNAKKRILAFLCALLAVCLAGCVPNGVQTIPTGQGAASPAPTSPSGASSSGAAGAEAQPENAGLNPLTGLPLRDGGGLRPVAVAVDNHPASWPGSGLAGADIVFETLVWENITRFAALYSEYRQLPVAGPVRELHMPLLQCVFSAQPIFVTEGLSGLCEDFIKENAYNLYIFDSHYGQSAVWENQKRLAEGMPIERTRYTDGGNLAGAIQVYGTDMQASGGLGFRFGAAGEGLPADASAAEAADSVLISFTQSNQTLLSFNAASMRYRMAQYEAIEGNYSASVDENTASQIEFDNVLVLFADVGEREDTGDDLYHDLLEMRFEEGGDGYYCYGGAAVPISWQKGGAQQPFRLSANGGELQLQPGTSYVALVNQEQRADFHLSQNPGESY